MDEHRSEIRRKFRLGPEPAGARDVLAGDDALHVEARRLKELSLRFRLGMSDAACLRRAEEKLKEVKT